MNQEEFPFDRLAKSKACAPAADPLTPPDQLRDLYHAGKCFEQLSANPSTPVEVLLLLIENHHTACIHLLDANPAWDLLSLEDPTMYEKAMLWLAEGWRDWGEAKLNYQQKAQIRQKWVTHAMDMVFEPMAVQAMEKYLDVLARVVDGRMGLEHEKAAVDILESIRGELSATAHESNATQAQERILEACTIGRFSQMSRLADISDRLAKARAKKANLDPASKSEVKTRELIWQANVIRFLYGGTVR